MIRLKARIGLIAAVAVAVLAVASAALALSFFEGEKGVGDSYFPKMGNTGYDVQHYDVKLRYRESRQVRATTLVEAVADTDGGNPEAGAPMDRFDLDFRGPKVTLLEVNGQKAKFRRKGQELIVSPKSPLPDGDTFTTEVRYEGRPGQILNPDGSRDGWTETRDGVVALGQPQAVPTFLPVNDHPTDKASFEIELEVPRELTGISNGVLVVRSRSERTTTTVWRQDEPMASYLAMVAIGRFEIDRGMAAGIPYFGAVDDRAFTRGDLKRLHENTRVAHRFLETVAGPYPFSATGGIADPSSLGFALENQSRSYYPGPPTRQLVIHEVAHQWYGDSVSVAEWDEIWLNEGIATYMEWLYVERERGSGESVADRFDRIYENNPASADRVWNPPPADPGGPENLFAGSVYDRGAMALQVLRQEIGNGDFNEVLKRWAIENADGNVTTQDFYDLISDVTGDPRPQSFDDWLYEPGKPDRP